MLEVLGALAQIIWISSASCSPQTPFMQGALAMTNLTITMMDISQPVATVLLPKLGDSPNTVS